MAIIAYVSWLVLIPIFGAKDSKFARFHANQGLPIAIAEIICWDEYDLASWCHLSDKEAENVGFNTLEIKYKSGKTFFFSQSQELFEEAQGMFGDINSCLSEYAGICK